MVDDRNNETLDLLKQSNFAGYLMVRMAPSSQQSDLTKLFRFYLDVLQIPAAVSEPALRAIRFQWCRDSIEQLTTFVVTGSVVFDDLLDQIQSIGEPFKNALLDVIDGIEQQSSEDPNPGVDQLFSLMRLHYGGLVRAQLLIAGLDGDRARELSTPCGDAIGFSSLIAAADGSAVKLAAFLPNELLQKHDVNRSDIFKTSTCASFVPLFEELASPLILDPADMLEAVRSIKPPMRLQLGAWYLSGFLYHKAMRLRTKGQSGKIDLNPLVVFFRLNSFRR